MNRPQISRRNLLFPAAGLAACAHQKATGFFGYCLVANQGSQAIGAVDLTRFRVRRQILLDAAPTLVLSHPNKPRAYALAAQGGTVYEIDATFLTLARRARAGNEAAGMRLSRNGDALWVLYRDPPGLVELPLESLRPARRIGLSAPPDDFDLDIDISIEPGSAADALEALGEDDGEGAPSGDTDGCV